MGREGGFPAIAGFIGLNREMDHVRKAIAMDMKFSVVTHGLASGAAGDTTGAQQAEKAAGESGAPGALVRNDSGDTADISEEGRALAAKMGEGREDGAQGGAGGAIPIGEDVGTDEDSEKEREIKLLEEKIEKVRQELKEAQQDDSLPVDQKMAKVMELTQRLMELTTELAKTKGFGDQSADQGSDEGFKGQLV